MEIGGMTAQRDSELGAGPLTDLGPQLHQNMLHIGGRKVGGFRMSEQGVQGFAVLVIHFNVSFRGCFPTLSGSV
jgi:hypothetical protein